MNRTFYAIKKNTLNRRVQREYYPIIFWYQKIYYQIQDTVQKKSDLEIETKTNFGSFLRPSKIWSHIVVLSMYTSINPFLPHPELKVIRHTYIATVGRNTN